MAYRDKGPVTGIILSGGKCSRMGDDKAFCTFRDKEMISYAIDVMKEFADEVIISANSANYKRFILPVITDVYRNSGPMGGLHAGFTAASHEDILVLSCDMPLAHPALFEALMSVSGDYDAIIPVHDGWKEPLYARYNKRILPKIEASLQSGRLKLMDLFRSLNTHLIDVTTLISTLPVDPFTNINSPEDLRNLQKTSPKDEFK